MGKTVLNGRPPILDADGDMTTAPVSSLNSFAQNKALKLSTFPYLTEIVKKYQYQHDDNLENLQ